MQKQGSRSWGKGTGTGRAESIQSSIPEPISTWHQLPWCLKTIFWGLYHDCISDNWKDHPWVHVSNRLHVFATFISDLGKCHCWKDPVVFLKGSCGILCPFINSDTPEEAGEWLKVQLTYFPLEPFWSLCMDCCSRMDGMTAEGPGDGLAEKICTGV